MDRNYSISIAHAVYQKGDCKGLNLYCLTSCPLRSHFPEVQKIINIVECIDKSWQYAMLFLKEIPEDEIFEAIL